MTDLPDGVGPEDRTLGLDPVDGFSFESDGAPIAELDIAQLDSLVDRGAGVAELAAGRRSWRFGHVIVDEAQDLTPMQWRMLSRRARQGSMTIVGDLAQRSTGEPGTWEDHLPANLDGFAYRELTINYRSPAEVNELASKVLAELVPDLPPSQAIRTVGHEPELRHVPGLDAGHHRDQLILDAVGAIEEEHPDRRIAVISVDPVDRGRASNRAPNRASNEVHFLSPWQAKGLEFDVVVLVEPARFLEQQHGLSLLYVGITRTTDRLVILHDRPLPAVLRSE